MPEDPTGAFVRNIFTLRRLENGLGREFVSRFLDDLAADVRAQMARLDPTAVQRRTFKLRRLERLLAEISELVGGTFDEAQRWLRGELAAIGKQQAGWAAATLGRTVGVAIGADAGINLFKAVLDEEPIQGRLLAEWVRDASDQTKANLSRQLKLGIAQNETLPQLIRRGRAVYDVSRRHMEGIVRTSVNHIANEGHLQTYRQNEDVLTGVEYTATLDTRTSDICISLDGRRWKLDDPGLRRPPQHPNCRSVLTPVVDWKGLGLESPPEGGRATGVNKDLGLTGGTVPASTTYPQWLKSQSKAVQNEVLGPAKAKLFREGKLDLRGLVTREGRSLTVAELEAKAG